MVLQAAVAGQSALASSGLSKFAKIGLGGGIQALGGLFGGGGDDTELEDLRSPEQKRAAALLSQLGETGSAGGLTLGEGFGGPLGEFNIDAQSRLGGSALENLLLSSSSASSDIGKARQTFTGLADTKFDPSDPKSGFASFNRALSREGKGAEDVLNRESAITGDRFGTAIAGEKADLAARMQDIRGQKLAQLFQGAQQTQLLGAQGLTGLANQTAQLAGLNINYGELQRQAKDAQAKASLNEFKRQRSEELSRIDILSQEAGRNPYMGISSLPGSPSPFSQLANSVLGSVGKQIGSEGIGSLFGGGGKTGGTPNFSSFAQTATNNAGSITGIR